LLAIPFSSEIGRATLADWRRRTSGAGKSVLLVLHVGGGTERHVCEIGDLLEKNGFCSYLLKTDLSERLSKE
jgi:hypothetical protein